MFSVVLVALFSVSLGAQNLGGYNVDLNQWSVSGFSSGAAMATQMHVAFSKEIMGVGLVAGAVYYCAKSSIFRVTYPCMQNPAGVDVGDLVSETNGFAYFGQIDPTTNMDGDKVYILSGTADTTVDPGNGPKLQQYYANYATDTKTEFSINAEHAMISDNYGGACDKLNPFTAYINNCGFNAAYEMLNHIYGGLTRPSGTVTLNGDFYQFNQREFFTASLPSAWSMDTVGYVYVPSECVSGSQCRLHVVFHGCQQGRFYVGDTYATKAGYNEVGELNNIIILYPQVIPNPFVNPYGCWDIWSYNNCFPYLSCCYATKNGVQPKVTRRMMRQVSSQPW